MAEKRTLWADIQLLALDAPELARTMRPGQFALARDPTTFDPYLRRTLWLYQIDGERVAFILSARDPFTARARVDDLLDLLAPLGRAIELGASARHVVLAADFARGHEAGEGTRLARLVGLAHNAIEEKREVALVSGVLSGAQPGDEIFPAQLLPPEVEYRVGDDALNTELIAWADVLVASGSMAFYRALAERVRGARYRIEPGFAQVLIDIAMPCGTGVCYACAVETRHGIRLACVDGPALDLAEFENRREP